MFDHRIKKISIFIFTIAVLFGVAHFVSAQTGDLTGLSYAEGTGLGNADPIIVIAKIIRIFLELLGIVALVLILYAGFIWMTSEGSEEKITKAKDILKSATIGLLIIFSAFAVVSFILNKLLGDSGGSGEGDGNGSGYGGSIGALGSGIIKNVYPEPNQKEVPRNTSMIVTFREKIDPQTICETTGSLCAGEKIIKENIRIFQTSLKDACAENCDSNITDVKVYSKDNETFVFAPGAYLGSPTESIWHSVVLSSGIKKADGELAFGLSIGYEWQFEVSSKLDLTPPQILSGGVFPAADDYKDEAGSTVAAVSAVGKIIVESQPQVYAVRSVGVPSGAGNSGSATITGEYNCEEDGVIAVSIDNSSKVLVSGVAGLIGGDDATDGKAALGCGLTLAPADGTLAAGDSWTFSVVQEKGADILTIGNVNYTFISGTAGANQIEKGTSLNLTATNIRNALANNASVISSGSGAEIILTAKTAGKSGNNIYISTTNASALNITAMSGGADKISNSSAKGKTDKPKNTVIQINFNEAVNPMTVSGASEEVNNYIRVVNLLDNSIVAGNFVISNQYKTVEFVSNVLCGANACGEKIFCLPGNSNLKVELVTANLLACGDSGDCASKNPYGNCTNGFCYNTTAKLNYPGANPSLDGITDVCFNSLDGDRDANAEGPVSFYNENASTTPAGDSYKWSFFISDELDLTAPTVISTDAHNNGTGVDLYGAISMTFDKVMMSSRLSTGSVTVNNGQEDVVHQLINLSSTSNQPLGYWVTNEGVDTNPADGEAESTIGYLEHTDFADQTGYRAQIGSGIRDIYQNCYKPCAGEACNGISDASPSCCSGVVTASSTCQ